MKRILVSLFLVFFFVVLSFGKPMESIANYNIIMVHGAYGSDKGIPEDKTLPEADSAQEFLGNANIGSYDNTNRIGSWLSKIILREPSFSLSNSSIYHWRSFTNPANSSINNAYELGYRTWNKDKTYGKRRALVEEAQEVKAFYVAGKDTSHGQVALDSMRHNPDLYRQLASRYILIGHSMGGVVSREYVQGNFYNGDVDKIITLDSPHKGTGALNMQLGA